MEQKLVKTNHFTERLNERFPHKQGRVDFNQFELVTSFSSNRFNHPRVVKYLKNPKYRNYKYLVSPKLNMVIPVLIRDSVVTTVLYYRQ